MATKVADKESVVKKGRKRRPHPGVYRRGRMWWVRLRMRGERIEEPVGSDLKLAIARRKELEARKAAGRVEASGSNLKPRTRATLTRWKKEYLASRKQAVKNGSLAASTYQRGDLAKIPAFCEWAEKKGVKKPSQITPSLLTRWITHRKRAGMTPATIQNDLRVLKKFFNAAIDAGHMTENPLVGRQAPKVRVPDKGAGKWHMTLKETKALFKAVKGHPLEVFMALGTDAGLRISEILFIEWEDVDFEAEELAVRNKPEKGFTVKSYHERKLGMTDRLLKFLRREKKRARGPWVFSDQAGERVEIRAAERDFKEFVEEAGMGWLSPHKLRHTFGTTLAHNNVPLPTLQRLMGHSQMTTTMRYLHTDEEAMMEAIETLNNSHKRELKLVGGGRKGAGKSRKRG